MEITSDTLFTVTGATLAVGLITQGISLVVSLSAYWKRVLALALGVAIIGVGAIVSGPGDLHPVPFYLLAVLTGITVALAASGGQETINKGLDRTVTSSEDD